MLAWPDGLEWLRDNRWRPLDDVPRFQPVDVWASRHAGSEHFYRAQYRRHFGCTFDGRNWQGLPPGWRPMLWTDAMSARRRAERTVTVHMAGALGVMDHNPYDR